MRSDKSKTAWIIVAGGFHQRGGMDKANYALASYLAGEGERVFLVSHDVDPVLGALKGVEVTQVTRPLGSVFLGEFALDRAGRAVNRRFRSEGWHTRLIANGASCLEGDINWVHYVHGAWRPAAALGGLLSRLRGDMQYRICCFREKLAFQSARLIITNSDLTTTHVGRCLGSSNSRTKTIYLGADELSPVTEQHRAVAKSAMNLPAGKPVALFAGALALDSRKGLDVLLKSWRILSREPDWDVTLLIAGAGPAAAAFQREVEQAGLSDCVRFLGFRKDMGSVLAASDILVSPVRYEPYGLNVQEALLSGISVLTSATAGIAERFPPPLRSLLISDPESVSECVAKLLLWRSDIRGWQTRFALLGDELRERSWHDMARDIVSTMNAEWTSDEARKLAQASKFEPVITTGAGIS